MSLYLGENLISGVATPVEPSRNIGQIIQSTLPLTDAGLHLLDGSLILGGGIYQGFVDYIADLYTENPSANYFTTEALWQTAVTTYGVCGKFVYDSANNTVRLPKITGILEGTTDVSALGDLVEAGLPNITGEWTPYVGGNNSGQGWDANNVSISGAFGRTATRSAKTTTNTSGAYSSAGVTFDASKSSPIYGRSSTVQPQTIKALLYIVVATSTKTDIQVDIDNIVTDLNGKADTDLTNVTDRGYIKMAGASMPSNTYKNLTLGASGSTYAAPADGFVSLEKKSGGSNQYAILNNTSSTLRSGFNVPSSGMQLIIYIPVKKGDIFSVSYNLSGSTDKFRFYYAVGSESEA